MIEFVFKSAAFPLGHVKEMVFLRSLEQFGFYGFHRLVVRLSRRLVLRTRQDNGKETTVRNILFIACYMLHIRY